MYSNPSRFAPKVKKTGGEAYPQAPTMDQFYSYGAPTPPTPFVFQDGGGMNDIQKMHSRYKNHYMKKGGVTSFEESKPNRANNFLSAIKNRAYTALQKELEQEEMNLQQGYNQAAMDMDMGYMQYGGNYGYNMDFTAANQWAKAADNTANMNKAFGNFGKIAEAFTGTPTETYIKSIKYKPMPIAQTGLNLRDQAELPFNYGSNMYGVNAMNPSYGNVMTENLPSMGTPMTGMIQSGEGYGYGRNLIPTEDPYAAEETVYTPSNPTSGMSRDEALAFHRSRYSTPINLPPAVVGSRAEKNQVISDMNAVERMRNTPLYSDDEYIPELKSEERPVDGSVIDPIIRREEPLQLITPKDIPAGGLRGSSTFNTNSSSIVEKTLGDLKTKRDEAERRRLEQEEITKRYEEAVKKKKQEDMLPPTGTEIVKNPDGTESSISPTEAARRKAEAAKNSDCPDGNCNKPKDGSGSNQPAPGSQEEAQKAAAAGMSPEQYRTFLTRTTVNNRRALLPGNRLKSMDFYFDTYGPGMNPVTASTQGAGMQDRGVSNTNNSNSGNGFFDRVFRRADEQSRWNPENDVHRFSSRVKSVEAPVSESTFETEGYADKNYMSDFRNQRATNRLNQLGQRIDRNIQRENSLDQYYNAPISDRMERLRDRDLRRYNRVADRFNRDEYTAPAFAMGGGMGYFQDGGEDNPFGIAEYSADGTDTTEREDYAGNTIYEDYPKDPESQGNEMQKVAQTKATVKFGQYNPYEAPMYMAGLDVIGGMGQNLDASQKEKELKNKTTASEVFTSMPDMSKGDYTVNEGYFKPDEQVPTQFKGYNFKSPYAKMGGSYKKGGEYYLTQEEIDEIIAMGGQVEFLD